MPFWTYWMRWCTNKKPPASLEPGASFLSIPAILHHRPWRNAKSALEVVIQMALIGKPHLVRDFGDGLPAIMQQRLRLLDPALEEILVWREAGRFFELAAEIGRTQPDNGRKVGERMIFVKPFMNIRLHPAKLVRGQALGGDGREWDMRVIPNQVDGKRLGQRFGVKSPQWPPCLHFGENSPSNVLNQGIMPVE